MTTIAVDTQAILDAFLAARGFRDDHRPNEEFRPWTQVAVYTRNDKTHVVPVHVDSYFCVNPLYLDEDTGEVHLCRRSVGGTVDNYRIPMMDRLRNFNQLVPIIKDFDLGKFSTLYTIVGDELVAEPV